MPPTAASTVIAAQYDRYPQGIKVYNFRVAQSETYFVREEGSTAQPVWVHNAYSRALSAAEEATKSRLQAKFPDLIFTNSEHVGEEFVDQFGHTYDAVGGLRASKFWNATEFLDSISRHFQESVDFVVIDLTGFTADQISVVENYISSISSALRARIMRIGF